MKKKIKDCTFKEFTGWANARACDGRWSMLDAMNSISVISMVYEVKPLEIDDYHVYVNTGIKEIHEEAKEGDLSSGFDGFEIETQEIYEKDEYIQLMAEKNSSLEEQATDLQLALADVYEQMLGLSAK